MGYKYDFDPRCLLPENLTRETGYLLGVVFADGAIFRQACGEARSGPVRKSWVKRASVKQEENTALSAA